MKRIVSLSLSTLGFFGAACGSSPPPIDLDALRVPPKSCAYMCPNSECAEQTTPYQCDALAPWDVLPHDDPCPAWDAKYPNATPGQCTASDPTSDAIVYAGSDGKGHIVLADGRWIAPSGGDAVFGDLPGGLTSGMILVPSTTFALTVDTGYDDHVVRLVDLSLIGTSDPTLAKVQFAAPETLNSGLAFIAPDLVYIATDDGVVQALTLDTAGKTLVRDDSRNLPLPPAKDGNGNTVTWYASAVAASPDGSKLLVSSVNTTSLLVYDVASKQLTGQVNLGKYEAYGVWIDPTDTTGTHGYVSLWQDHTVVDVDVTDPAAPTVARTFDTDKDPQSIAFLDARYFVVGNDLGDSITIVDRTTGTTTKAPTDGRMALYGQEPSALTYDSGTHRLYATLAGMNAIAAYDVNLSATPPTVTFAGRMPVGYWPSAIATEPDGTVIVTNLRGHGEGPRPLYFDIGNADIGDRMHGSLERIDTPTTGDLQKGDTDVATFANVAGRDGSPVVTCPNGANDFPIPSDPTTPSTRIDHVFIIVRENKGYDALFGDFTTGNGEADYAFKASTPGEMDQIWHNLRTLSRTFTMSDDYYTQAIYSTQGHVWTTYGRANDFDERTWIVSGSRNNARPIPGGGLIDVSRPVEGSLFDWLGANGVPYDVLGEIVGTPVNPPDTHPPIDVRYPGGPFQNIGYNDLEKACYASARARAFCNFGNVIYMTLPNDHTFGVSPTNPTPETFCAVNDEATGMFIDGLSHSPLWATSLVMITEDDPSQGGEHVDNHRAPFVVVSPFVKHGYVSHTHIDVASMHKILANVIGKPYPNALVANAAVPFDMFTSTPDYTPYTYTPRTFPLACGPKGAAGEKSLTDLWDLSEEDSQPGLDAQVTRWMHGHPLASIPEATMSRVRRIQARQGR